MKTPNPILAVFLLTSLVAPVFSEEPSADKTAPVSYPILSGVGMALRVTDDSIYIGKVLPNTVADRSRAIHDGDQLLSVQNDGKLIRVQGKPLGDVISMIRGPVGTKVTLEVRHKEQIASIKVTLTREPIRVAGVTTYGEFIGQAAPELSFSPFDDSKVLKLPKFRGKIVVLDFWASWCGTCYPPIDRLQEIARAHPKWKDEVILMSVSVDIERDKAAKVIQERKWNRTINVSIDYDMLKSVGVRALPALLIVSQEGTITVMGGSHAIDVEKEVARLLAPHDP